MGGRYEVELCTVLLEEHFGISVSKVAEAVMKESGPLPVIVNRLKNKVKLSTIRRALVVLEQHRMVNFKIDQNMRVIYTIDRCAILSLARAARYIIFQYNKKCIYIFRLLQLRGYLEEDQIEKLTMMSSKETRELLYAMLEEGYVFTKPIGKTNDFAPARTFFLYHVNLPQTVRGLVEYTCKMMRNMVLRRSFESREHKHLTERQVKMESIMETIASDDNLDEETKKQQMTEVEEMYLSNADRAMLDRFRKAQTLLIASETESEKALFAFRLFMDFASRIS
uniref:DNA-directed RNA polymerase III subunit RPC3 n=1 Tax=Heterorhabditis bacteriophora TaxID=37862 RepID=A0A1I7WTX9_HETBA